MRGKDEDETRKQMVDKALRDAGWPIEDFHEGMSYDTAAVREYETANGPADYVLFVEGTRERQRPDAASSYAHPCRRPKDDLSDRPLQSFVHVCIIVAVSGLVNFSMSPNSFPESLSVLPIFFGLSDLVPD